MIQPDFNDWVEGRRQNRQPGGQLDERAGAELVLATPAALANVREVLWLSDPPLTRYFPCLRRLLPDARGAGERSDAMAGGVYKVFVTADHGQGGRRHRGWKTEDQRDFAPCYFEGRGG